MTEEEFNALFAGTSIEYAIELGLGETVTANIKNGGQYVYYKITTTSAGNYNFYLYGGDTMIYIYDENGSREKTLYASWDSGYTTIDEDYYLSADSTYYVAVRFYYSSETGSLDLCVTAP